MYPKAALHYLSSDDVFDQLFPVNIQQLSAVHWTPLNVAGTAAKFLGPNAGDRVLDIGAGAGKFCIAGSILTNATFTGIEQRKHFVQAGNKVIGQLGLTRARLLHGNFIDMDISGFNGIYFFNAFHENISLPDSLDEKVERSEQLHELYTASLHQKLTDMPAGTRLATFWLTISEVPGCYRLLDRLYNDQLKLWVKC